MSERTTCSSCRHLDPDDKGRPVDSDSHVVGLCHLTRPEVKERIQKKLEKGGQVDEDTCPKCQHDVGDHVAKDDDGMRIALLSLSPFSLTPLYLALSPSHTMRVSHHLSAHPASPAMTWPPQPVGQNPAQGMSLFAPLPHVPPFVELCSCLLFNTYSLRCPVLQRRGGKFHVSSMSLATRHSGTPCISK
eukprot:TRINITY_DN42_c0_g1_i16.p1 TRINITY_DN42_c0_g1~~TRINITY_DN42_c0_g1_i16.p1  ORF type:complete len:189 (+),score=18.02 TRINITY_DN42_c0_g1_i16:243-809(+)